MPGMTSREAFGPNLRRLRLRAGISIEEVSARTNVSAELWEAMEHNDFSRWPTGVAARAYVRDYATIVGLDPDETIDEFCRIVPDGAKRTRSHHRSPDAPRRRIARRPTRRHGGSEHGRDHGAR